MTKRHTKPTAVALAERTYRKVLKFHSTLLNQMAHIRLDISAARREDREHIVKLIDHCARLLREKETLQRRLEAMRKATDSSAIFGQPSHNHIWGDCHRPSRFVANRTAVHWCPCGSELLAPLA